MAAWAAVVVAHGIAAILLWSSLEKARAREATVSTLRQLGLPGGIAEVATWTLVCSELVLAVGLLVAPSSVGTLLGIVVLGSLFAGAGAVGLRGSEQIRCGCFGLQGEGELGKTQIRALPLWLAGVVLLWQADLGWSSLSETVWSFTVVALLLASVRAAFLLNAWKSAREDRRSAEKMLVWLPQS